MTKFYIKYNPYTVECIFKKNGEILNDNSKIGSKKDERLQILLGEASLTNWHGLFNEIADECDDDAVQITFEGRKIDFEDLQYAEQLYNGEVNFSLIFIEARNDEDVIEGLDKIFADIKEKNLPAFKQKNRDGKDIFDAYDEAKNGIFEVSVIATMSSGKSTLINALLNTELLPSENKACTANIVNILDNDSMETYEAECIGRDGKTIIHPRETVNLEKLTAYNKDNSIGTINIEGNIPGIASDKISLRLKDTPGPNNAQDIRHRELTYSIIKNTNSVVLYVMNATQLGTDDDKQLLQDIADEMKKYGKQSRDRFIFVLNKCDANDTEGSDGPTDLAISDAKLYLLKNFGITDPIIIPTSAKMALLINKVKNGEHLTRKERHQYDDWLEDSIQLPQLHFENFATLTPTIYKKLCAEAVQYHQSEDTWDMEALIHTGVPSVEQAIGEYIDKYAYPMKVHDAIKDIDAILKDLNMQTRFSIENAENQSVLSKTRQEIESANKKLKESNKIYDKFKKKIEKFGIDPNDQRKEEYEIEHELDEKTKPYDGMTRVDKVEADRLINSFIEDLTKYQEKCERRLRTSLEVNINQTGQDMIKAYTKSLQQILSEVQIHGYEFQNTYSFNKMRINNLKELQSQYETIRYREETRTKKNPEREGLGFFKFWEPWTIEYKVQLEDGIDVDVHKVIVDGLSSFKLYTARNIRKMYEQANIQVDSYKKVFLENLNNLYNEIAKIINELDEKTRNEKKLQAEVENNSKLMQWEAEKEHELRSILEF